MAERRTINRLTDREAKCLTKQGRHADGGNLYLSIRGGSRGWVFFYRFNGKLREMSLGAYPIVSLSAARQLAAAARALAKAGIDPLQDRRRVGEERKQAELKAAGIPTFGAYALTLVGRIEDGFRNATHRQQWRNTLMTYCQPVWDMPVDKVDTAGVLACLAPIWQSKPETAQRVRGRIERVLNAAKAEKLRSGENPASWKGHLDATLPKPSRLTRGHYAALAYDGMPAFIADLRKREALTAMALEFTILTATRTGEALGARWDEFDLDAGLWTIPAERMKARREHRVPLSSRAVELVKGLGAARVGEHVFPGRRPSRSLSSKSMLMLLRRMGRSDITAHGFRSAFSDWASEISPFSAEVRETALAHTIVNKAEAAYRRGDALERRRTMMEAWAQWCEPKADGNVIQFAKSGGGA